MSSMGPKSHARLVDNFHVSSWDIKNDYPLIRPVCDFSEEIARRDGANPTRAQILESQLFKDVQRDFKLALPDEPNDFITVLDEHGGQNRILLDKNKCLILDNQNPDQTADAISYFINNEPKLNENQIKKFLNIGQGYLAPPMVYLSHYVHVPAMKAPKEHTTVRSTQHRKSFTYSKTKTGLLLGTGKVAIFAITDNDNPNFNYVLKKGEPHFHKSYFEDPKGVFDDAFAKQLGRHKEKDRLDIWVEGKKEKLQALMNIDVNFQFPRQDNDVLYDMHFNVFTPDILHQEVNRPTPDPWQQLPQGIKERQPTLDVALKSLIPLLEGSFSGYTHYTRTLWLARSLENIMHQHDEALGSGKENFLKTQLRLNREVIVTLLVYAREIYLKEKDPITVVAFEEMENKLRRKIGEKQYPYFVEMIARASLEPGLEFLAMLNHAHQAYLNEFGGPAKVHEHDPEGKGLPFDPEPARKKL